ncbi:unnamed protein product [Closterium sp. NIES-64]|nr:unnamed protein product [Closterium sp. NIES-64]
MSLYRVGLGGHLRVEALQPSSPRQHLPSAHVPPAPHLEDCAARTAFRQAAEQRGADGEPPAWTRPSNCCGCNPQPPWVSLAREGEGEVGLRARVARMGGICARGWMRVAPCGKGLLSVTSIPAACRLPHPAPVLHAPWFPSHRSPFIYPLTTSPAHILAPSPSPFPRLIPSRCADQTRAAYRLPVPRLLLVSILFPLRSPHIPRAPSPPAHPFPRCADQTRATSPNPRGAEGPVGAPVPRLLRGQAPATPRLAQTPPPTYSAADASTGAVGAGGAGSGAVTTGSDLPLLLQWAAAALGLAVRFDRVLVIRGAFPPAKHGHCNGTGGKWKGKEGGGDSPGEGGREGGMRGGGMGTRRPCTPPRFSALLPPPSASPPPSPSPHLPLSHSQSFCSHLSASGALHCYFCPSRWGKAYQQQASVLEVEGVVRNDDATLKAYWWQAQALRFLLRWPSALLCHATNRMRHSPPFQPGQAFAEYEKAVGLPEVTSSRLATLLIASESDYFVGARGSAWHGCSMGCELRMGGGLLAMLRWTLMNDKTCFE